MSELSDLSRRNDVHVMKPEGTEALIRALIEDGYEVIGPKVIAQAMLYEPYEAGETPPAGWTDEQDGGRYRLIARDDRKLFDYVVGPQGFKRYLFPPREKLWSAKRTPDGFAVGRDGAPAKAYAFFGARACEVAAIAVQDRVFDNGEFADPTYNARRAKAFIVSVDCSRSASTCFCDSMGTGPAPEAGYDIRLSEIFEDGHHVLLVRSGSEAGAAILEKLDLKKAKKADLEKADANSRRAAEMQTRVMPEDAREVLARNMKHSHWVEVGKRCLGCGSCTMVCPTCFCAAMEDVTGLDPDSAERWRQWDTCFSVNHSFIHGGAIRQEAWSRYRQWITHKLSFWHEQFGQSGCVGCGRCITWCPVAIDIVEETRTIRDSEKTEALHG
ncbi:4Fe-4S dicluster domain-containing protein [Rhodobium gokarnense]|uniref:Ferredoxin n=1 Tax=Rhodobium gokarnense TaxID=364296 RepID=A0ABT3H9N8_9HYPH|nr:4Fe-4S dicluster domain-containing protein [Rhodobium gokarnense]MCW2307103.1 ferredoxin [Rhodobium gokarnense]